jgi:hypothetical protein
VSALPDARIGAVFFSGDVNDPNLPCGELQALGVHTTFIGAWWGLIEPLPGQYDWSSVDPVVDAALACRLEPVVKVSTGAGPGIDGTPPEDLEAFSRFIFNLAQHLKGRVRAYAIENEIDKVRLAWTAETYGPLRAAAYGSIKQADPDAYVLDSGMTMQAYIMARADELYRAGQTQQALDMLGRVSASARRQSRRLPTNERRLAQWLDDPKAQRIVALVHELYANPETYNAIQLHYLQDAWEFLPEYVSWVQTWSDKPYEFWEIGYGWEGSEFSEEDHASGVVKTLVTALGEGASRVIYEPYAEAGHNTGRGLVPSDGPRLAATAYQTMVSQLSGYSHAERLDLGSGLWAYRFDTPRGDVYVVWAEEGGAVSLPLDAAQATVTDIIGGSTTADPAALPVGASPIFVSAP